ncbi:MAG: GNAT family N-acetyltransferase [Sphingomonadales bacterium]|nr:GNAT family N-acetyltransferase [Sphingomonadales bacterium]
MIEVKEAGSEAVGSIMPVMQAAFDPAYGEAWTETQCAGALGLPGCFLVTATLHEDVVGFAIVRSVLDEAELMLIAVKPACHRGGIGRALLDTVEAKCGALGVSKLHVEMREDNPARDFYIDAGFTLIGERRNYYPRLDGKSANALTFCRVLTKDC